MQWDSALPQFTAWRISSLNLREGEPRLSLTELRSQSWESGRWRWTEFTGWVWRKRELHRGKTLKIWRGSPLVLSRVVISTYRWRNCRAWKKNHARGLGEQCPHFHRAGLSACSHEADWSISWFTHHWMERAEGSCLSSGE